MSKEKPTLVRESAVQRAHREMKELKPLLPTDWRIRFFLKYKDYDTAGGGRLVNDVYNLRTTDVFILDGLKEVAKEYAAEIEKQVPRKK